jgi:regulator of protease activity HflC (stomatin/prohibitin superfamily)
MGYVLFVVAAFLVVAVIGGGVYFFMKIEVREQQKVVIERLGKYCRVLDPGWNIKWPFIDRKRQFCEDDGRMIDYVDLRERTADLPEQLVITKDKIEVRVDSVAYYQISDAYKAIYSQKNVLNAINQKIKTELRNVIGDTELSQLVKDQESISQLLQSRLQESAKDWGITLRSVELQAVTPPESFKRVSEAEIEVKRAKLEREAAIERAEGRKQASILEAEGEAEKINKIYSAIHAGNPNDELLKIKYLEALEKIADGKATKVFMPFPTNPGGGDFFQQAFGMAAGLDAYKTPNGEAEPKPGPGAAPGQAAAGNTGERRLIKRVIKKPVPPSGPPKVS